MKFEDYWEAYLREIKHWSPSAKFYAKAAARDAWNKAQKVNA